MKAKSNPSMIRSEDGLTNQSHCWISIRSTLVIAFCAGVWAMPGVAQAGTIIIAQSGDAPPDSNGTFQFFGTPALGNSGQVGFWTVLTGTSGGSSDDNGMFLGTSSGLTQIARNSDTAPDSNGTFVSIATINDPSVNASGQALFAGFLSGTSGGSSDDQGYFHGSGGALTQIVREGQASPDSNGTYSSFDTFAFNDSGQAAFRGILIGTSGGNSDNLGVFRSDGGTLTQIGREGQPAPDSNGTFSGITADISLNDSGQVAFKGLLSGTSGGSGNGQGIFLGSGGALTQVVREEQAAPDSNGTISSIDSPSLNASGQVAFQGFLTGTSGGFSDDTGIFLGSGGALTRIVREGDSAPDSNGAFGFTAPPVLNDAGQVAFRGGLSGTSGGSSDQNGIFLSSGGTVIQVARGGEAAPDGNGTIRFFEDPTLNATGQVAFTSFNMIGTSGGTSDNAGIFIGDGQETFQAARKGQALGGSTITALSFSNSTSGQGEQRSGLNDFGQVAYHATLANGDYAIGLFTPELTWRTAGDGDWDTGANWTLSLDPALVHDTTIDPTVDSMITGPAAATTVKSLTIGEGSSLAHLQLQTGVNLTSTEGVSIGQNGLLSGAGTVTGDLVLTGEISPGNSPGEMTIDGDATLEGGSSYLLEVGNASGAAGSGWDLLSITGSALVTATVGDELLIDLTSLDGSNAPGQAINFNATQSYSWTFLTADSGLTGFDLDAVTLLTSNFQNNLSGGSFSLQQQGNSLNLLFTAVAQVNAAVPEPSTLSLAAFGFLALLKRRRRQA